LPDRAATGPPSESQAHAARRCTPWRSRPRGRGGGQPTCCGAVEGGGRPKRAVRGSGDDGGRRLPVQLVCRVVDISESGYHDGRTRAPSQRVIRHA
jgi:hypothetical protein